MDGSRYKNIRKSTSKAKSTAPITCFADHTYHLSKREERTTDTEEAAIAAEPIHGCRTSPTGMNTPRRKQAAMNIPEIAIEPFHRVPL